MSRCGASRALSFNIPFAGASVLQLCSGGLSVALPGPQSNAQTGKILPAVEIPNAMMIVNVSRISRVSGNFTIGPCDMYPGHTRVYEEGRLPETVPLIVSVLGQCVTVSQSAISDQAYSTYLQTAAGASRVRDGSHNGVGGSGADDQSGMISFDITLVGDYCAAHPDSAYCHEVNKFATAGPPSSGASRVCYERGSRWLRGSVGAVTWMACALLLLP